MDFNPKRKMVRDVEARQAEEERIIRERLEAEQRIAEAKRVEKAKIRKQAKEQTKAHRSPQNRKYNEQTIQHTLEHVEGSNMEAQRLAREEREKRRIARVNKKDFDDRIKADRALREEKIMHGTEDLRIVEEQLGREEAEAQYQRLIDAGYDVEGIMSGLTGPAHDNDGLESDTSDSSDTDDTDSDILDPEEARLEGLPKQIGSAKAAQIFEGAERPEKRERARKTGVKKSKDAIKAGEWTHERVQKEQEELLQWIAELKFEISEVDKKIDLSNNRLIEMKERGEEGTPKYLSEQKMMAIYKDNRRGIERDLAQWNSLLRGKKWQ